MMVRDFPAVSTTAIRVQCFFRIFSDRSVLLKRRDFFFSNWGTSNFQTGALHVLSSNSVCLAGRGNDRGRPIFPFIKFALPGNVGDVGAGENKRASLWGSCHKH